MPSSSLYASARGQLFAATLAASLSTVAASAQVPRTARSAASVACGVERWRVKIVADESRDGISWLPETTSVASLRRIPAPSSFPATRRIAPYELTLYRVHAVVRQILTEADGDWHVVLSDPDHLSETLVAEIPDSACALGSGHESDYGAARRTLRGIPRNGLIELDGLGFFDYLHGQRGMAPNGFELHPVIRIRTLDSLWEAGEAAVSSARDTAPMRQLTDSGGQASGNAEVWLNTNSLVYHCSDSRWYGHTKNGQFMRESDAAARGARPAYGRRCGSALLQER